MHRQAALVLLPLLAGACAVGDAIFANEWEERGAQQARDDIAAGRPAIRSDALAFGRDRLVDDATGLPLEDWSVHCGTGHDWDRHEGLVHGYNAVIRSAYDAGRLRAFRLADEVRKPEQVRAAFDGSDVTRLRTPGQGFETPDRRFRVELRSVGTAAGDVHVVSIHAADGTIRHLGPASPHVDVVLLADGTTLLVRSSRGTISSCDLRSGRTIQTVY